MNFLKILLTPHQGYLFNDDALFYLECFELPQKLLARLRAETGWLYEDDESCSAARCLADHLGGTPATADRGRLVGQLARARPLQRSGVRQRRCRSVQAARVPARVVLVHMERHVAQLIPLTDDQRAAHEAARDAIWDYYQRLKAYRESPTPSQRARLEAGFDRLFLKETRWPELNELLRKIHGKKSELLLVLDHPEIPLHNNLSENDIRQYVKKRKISAGRGVMRAPLPGHLPQPEDDLPEAWHYLLALSSGSYTGPPRHPSAGRPDPTKGR